MKTESGTLQEISRGEPVVTLEGVSLGYGRRILHAGLSLQIRRGEFWGIVGPNGSGKTTLLRAILGTQAPLAGTIQRERGIAFGYVPQTGTLDEGFPLTVFEIAMMGRYRRVGLLRRPGAGDRDRVLQALEDVGIRDLADRTYRDLSGGQKQRCLIARALAGDPDVLVLDEPTTGVDLTSQKAILDLVRDLHGMRRLTVLMVSHHLTEVANLARRIVLMDARFIQVGSVREVISTENLTRLYGIPVQVERIQGRIVVLPLEIPDEPDPSETPDA